MNNEHALNDIVGRTVASFTRSDHELVFETTDGLRYVMSHTQDCCEQVYIEDIVGDLDDLVGVPILMAEERSNYDDPPTDDVDEDDSYTWTFYEFATVKGSVTIRWFGTSNGYYSEVVDFVIEADS